jgi:hypothetical protein
VFRDLIATLDCDRSPERVISQHKLLEDFDAEDVSYEEEEPHIRCIPRSNVWEFLNLFFNSFHSFRATN